MDGEEPGTLTSLNRLLGTETLRTFRTSRSEKPAWKSTSAGSAACAGSRDHRPTVSGGSSALDVPQAGAWGPTPRLNSVPAQKGPEVSPGPGGLRAGIKALPAAGAAVVQEGRAGAGHCQLCGGFAALQVLLFDSPGVSPGGEGRTGSVCAAPASAPALAHPSLLFGPSPLQKTPRGSTAMPSAPSPAA